MTSRLDWALCEGACECAGRITRVGLRRWLLWEGRFACGTGVRVERVCDGEGTRDGWGVVRWWVERRVDVDDGKGDLIGVGVVVCLWCAWMGWGGLGIGLVCR